MSDHNKIYDLLIIGGGINGTAIARDASGRGLSVCLVEQADLASGTSSASSKLIHGGLRYLEQYQFGMVRKALREREIALKQAPHLTHPLAFILPHQPQLRSQWMIQAGLWLYDNLAKRNILPASRRVSLHNTLYGAPLKPTYQVGFEYYDCMTDDARLVISLALDAHQRGATIMTYHQLVGLRPQYQHWQADIKDHVTQQKHVINAKVIVNATGPWSNHFFQSIRLPAPRDIVLVKGSHIVVPKLYDGDHAYILQNDDGRVVFVLPYLQYWSLVGTTDIPYENNPSLIEISQDEIAYLCQAVDHHFKQAIDPNTIIWSYAGVRPLVKQTQHNVSKISRDYTLTVQTESELPLLSVLGGKLTTHRELAEEVMTKLQYYFPCLTKSWTAESPLPGGDLMMPFDDFVRMTRSYYRWLPAELCERYARQYGTRIHVVLGDANKISDLGQDFGAGFYEREIVYLVTQEWAHTAEDLLYRRTKLGLFFQSQEVTSLQTWLNKKKFF